MITIKENNKNIEEFNLLYDEVGWGAYDKKITKKALDNTFYSVSIYNDDEIIGYGRLIGDTICFIYIQDVMVKPQFQNRKVGTMIMNKLLDKIKELKKENPNIRVYLGASKEEVKICEDNIAYIKKNAKFMTSEELQDFIDFDYSKQIIELANDLKIELAQDKLFRFNMDKKESEQNKEENDIEL